MKGFIPVLISLLPAAQSLRDETVSGSHFCQIDKGETVSSICNITFNEINEINTYIRSDLEKLISSDFFKYFKIDLRKECTFWDNKDGLCFSPGCAVDPIDDWAKVPMYWQPDILGSITNNTTEDIDIHDDECSFLDELCAEEKRLPEIPECNYCDVNDFENSNCVLVDLSKNRERFTGYGGNQSREIWSSIYNENCFSFGEVGKSLAKDTFYRLISGFHASIGTHVAFEHLNLEEEDWGPYLEGFMEKVGNFPERVTNIYFNYAVVAKTLLKIQPYLKNIEFCNEYNEDVKRNIMNIVSQLDSTIFNEDLLFENEISSVLKDDFKNRFRNVTKIMDCVQCERCKLWGKLQAVGYALSLIHI